jgi:hypothetical protein
VNIAKRRRDMSAVKRVLYTVGIIAALLVVVAFNAILWWRDGGPSLLAMMQGDFSAVVMVVDAIAVITAIVGAVNVIRMYSQKSALLCSDKSSSVSIERDALVSVARHALDRIPDAQIQRVNVDVLQRRGTAALYVTVRAAPLSFVSLVKLAEQIQEVAKTALESFTEHEVRYVTVSFVESRKAIDVDAAQSDDQGAPVAGVPARAHVRQAREPQPVEPETNDWDKTPAPRQDGAQESAGEVVPSREGQAVGSLASPQGDPQVEGKGPRVRWAKNKAREEHEAVATDEAGQGVGAATGDAVAGTPSTGDEPGNARQVEPVAAQAAAPATEPVEDKHDDERDEPPVAQEGPEGQGSQDSSKSSGYETVVERPQGFWSRLRSRLSKNGPKTEDVIEAADATATSVVSPSHPQSDACPQEAREEIPSPIGGSDAVPAETPEVNPAGEPETVVGEHDVEAGRDAGAPAGEDAEPAPESVQSEAGGPSDAVDDAGEFGVDSDATRVADAGPTQPDGREGKPAAEGITAPADVDALSDDDCGREGVGAKGHDGGVSGR